MSWIFHSAGQLGFSVGFHILGSSNQAQIFCGKSLTFRDRKLIAKCTLEILFDKLGSGCNNGFQHILHN